MNITITARKTIVKDSFREKVENRLAKLDRFFDDTAAAKVTVTNEGERETVEVTVQFRGQTYRAEKTTDDRSTALDAVVDSLFKQIVKNKTKLEARLRSNAFEAPLEDSLQEEKYQLLRTKRFPVSPMLVEEAILQMNLVGHEFYLFLNGETEELNVVYRRKDGSYGLLEPDFGDKD